MPATVRGRGGDGEGEGTAGASGLFEPRRGRPKGAVAGSQRPESPVPFPMSAAGASIFSRRAETHDL